MAEIGNAEAITAFSHAPTKLVESFGDEPQLDKTIAELHHAERYESVPGYIVIYATKSP